MSAKAKIAKAKITLFKLAQELNLATDTIKEFLQEKGLDVPSSPMKKLSLESWEAALEKFAPARFEEYLRSQEPVEEEPQGETLRKQDVEKLLHIEEPEPEKLELPVENLKKLRVLEHPEPEAPEPSEEEVTEAVAKEEDEVPAAAAEAVEEPAEMPEVEEKVEAAVPEDLPVEETELPAPESTSPESPETPEESAGKTDDKLSLPTFKPGKILQEAPEAPEEKEAAEPAPGRDRHKGKEVDTAPAREISDSGLDAGGKKRKRSRKKTKTEKSKLKDFERLKAALKGEDIFTGQELVDSTSTTPSRKKKRRGRKNRLDEKEILENIRQVEKAMDGGKTRRKHKRHVQGVGEFDEGQQVLRITEFISTQQLADLLDKDVSELISKTFEMGQLVTINQRLDRTLIELLCAEYDFTVEFITEIEDLEETIDEPTEEELEPRQPVVTVMGHVDHGKTSLLDYLRNTHVVDSESGNITQHIGAYEVVHNGKPITFLDTPGHQAFSAMRARGANITDLVILVVAADDSVQQQTLEAIDHSRAANVPIIVAINKIDKPNADPERIRKELSAHNILVEAWGGSYQCVEISAKKGTNIDELMNAILLQAELLELKGSPHGPARGVVIESKLDKGRGAMATILVNRGTLRRGDNFVVGAIQGKVRKLLDENGRELKEVGPARPVQVLGITGVPQAGDLLTVYPSEKEARQVMLKKQQLIREQDHQKIKKFSLESLTKEIQDGEVKELAVIIKADAAGSVEAIADEIMKIVSDEVRVDVVHKAVGAITENDVMLAAASKAIIIGFHVHPTLKAREESHNHGVDIRIYRIIYDITQDIRLALEGMLNPEYQEEITATLEVRQVFKISRVGTVAGCMVVQGKIARNNQVRLLRDNVEIFTGRIEALKRFKDDAKEVAQGFECGLQLVNYNDIKVGDIVEAFQLKEVKRTLAE